MKIRLHDGGDGNQWIITAAYIYTTTPTSIFGYTSDDADVSIPVGHKQIRLHDGGLIISEAK